MITKKLAIAAASAALVLGSIVPAFASYHKTVIVTKAEVNNKANVTNDVFTGSNTGLNFTSVSGNNTTVGGSTTSGEAEKGGKTGSTTGGATGGLNGNGATVSTGDAFAGAYVSNTVNTTVVRQ